MPDLNERYLNLVEIYLGEALVEIGNIRQRGGTVRQGDGTVRQGDGTPGIDFTKARVALLRAEAALRGELYVETPDPKHKDAPNE